MAVRLNRSESQRLVQLDGLAYDRQRIEADSPVSGRFRFGQYAVCQQPPDSAATVRRSDKQPLHLAGFAGLRPQGDAPGRRFAVPSDQQATAGGAYDPGNSANSSSKLLEAQVDAKSGGILWNNCRTIGNSSGTTAGEFHGQALSNLLGHFCYRHRKERHQVLLFLLVQLQFQNEVEELDGVFEREQAVVVQVGRRVLDAARGRS